MNTLANPKVKNTLAALHQQAAAQHQARDQIKDDSLRFMAVTAEEGSFLYFIATLTQAKNIIEFGCSFGISTIYLAAAARDNGGKVTTTEMASNKVIAAGQNLEEAGLRDLVTILAGDATQTLASVEQPVDLLFLDGAKHLYLPVYNLLSAKLSQGAVIVADNADKADAKPLVDLILQDTDKFTSSMLFEGRALVAYVK